MKLGEKIYLCKHEVDENGFVSYSKPIEFVLKFMYLTVMPASGNFLTEEYGQDISAKWNIVANEQYFSDTFAEGDILYLDGNKPDEKDENGSGANAVITSVRPQNRVIRIIAEKRDLQGKGLYVD